MENQFYEDIEYSNEITIENHNNRGKLLRIKESLIRLLSPIL